jgi:molybdenum cofactor cytidylyltransferase
MVAAIVLAAGQSRRMGSPKINLPWADSTILGHILMQLTRAGIQQIIVVLGDVQFENLTGEILDSVKIVKNPEASKTGMLTSLQVGMRQLGPEVQAFLVVLGDQPQISEEVVKALISEFTRTRKELIVPSYRMRRGHPWLVARSFWKELISLNEPETLRSFLDGKSSIIHYLNVGAAAILKDIDTPEDYTSEKPER